MLTSFQQRVKTALRDDQARRATARAVGQLKRLRDESFADEAEFQQLQAAGRTLRQRALEQLPALLERLEDQAVANGCQVFWAEDAAAANRYIASLVHRDLAIKLRGLAQTSTGLPAGSQASRGGASSTSHPSAPRHVCRIVKCRSAIAAEIGLDAALRQAGTAISAIAPPAPRQGVTAALVEVAETQLGDYIVQLAADQPSHSVYPAMHRRKEDVAALFEEKLDMPQTLDIQGMASMARYELRQKLLQADIGIGELAFAVAETGSLALAGESGNERLLACLPRTLVLLMGLEQVAATLEDLLLLLELRDRSATGQPLSPYVTLLNGPARPGDPDGPEEVHLVILDNGRGALLQSPWRAALACIHCGACLNVCPVYREIGGRAYGGAVMGPIGSVLLPAMSPLQPATGRSGQRAQPAIASAAVESPAGAAQTLLPRIQATPFADLPFASSLCGACSQVCPVGVDLPALLIEVRSAAVAAGRTTIGQRLDRRLFAWAMADSARYRQLARLAAWLARLPGRGRIWRLPPPLYTWASTRGFPLPARRTFRDRWQARQP